MTRLFPALCLYLTALSIAHAAGSVSLTLVDGWIRQAPPTARVLAGYGRLVNVSNKPIVIVSASSPEFEQVEMHDMRIVDGVMTMRALARIEIPPHAEFAFEPGAAHWMLIEPKHRLQAGEGARVDLRTSTGDAITLQFRVREP